MPLFAKSRPIKSLKLSLVISCLLALWLITTLIKNNVFILPWLAGYYSYLAVGIVIILITGIVILRTNVQNLHLPLPVLLFVAWVSYVVLNGSIKQDINLRHISILIAGGVFISFFLLLQYKLAAIKPVFIGITAVAFLEAAICVLQYLRILHSDSIYFPVMGTWDNPNVTAMFLVLAIPAMWICSLKLKTNFSRKLIYAAFSLIALALILLNCRTAYVGLAISLFILLNFKYQWLKSAGTRKINWKIAGFIFLVFIGSYALYQSKKNSADGRLLIYKISMQMALDKPLTGYGYGTFERNYNLQQAEYIRAGKASVDELQNAGFVRMGYNEFLESAVEGGTIGFILFTGLIILLIAALPKTEDDKAKAAYAGLVALAVMSMVNFSLRSMPLMYLFVVYAAVLCDYLAQCSETRNLTWTIGSERIFRYSIAALLILCSSWLFLSQYRLPYANYRNKAAFDLATQKQFQAAINVLDPLKTVIPDHDTYLKNYGQVLMANGNYFEAIEYFNKAKVYTSDPQLFLLTGQCHRKIGMPKEAIQEFDEACYLEPTRFLPRMALLNTYLKAKDAARAAAIALNIVNLTPKIPSLQVQKYKAAARQILAQLNYPIANLQPAPPIKTSINNPNTLFKQ
jgi:O-antigen ligase